MDQLIIKFITQLVSRGITKDGFLGFQRDFSRVNRVPFYTNDLLLEAYHKMVADKIIEKSPSIEKLLTLKKTRSDSGIVVVSVLTKPFGCPGKCIYCPAQPSAPKSYLTNEPAVMRAVMCKYKPYLQMHARLKALQSVGHCTDKISVRIIGGTWSAYPKRYQVWFVKELFRAANDFGQSDPLRPGGLLQLQSENEISNNRIVELSIETRQDFINQDELRRLRRFGVTKVELGVQSLYDDVLEFCKRGNNDQATRDATKMLKDAGFKVSYQMMLNLPKSGFLRDQKMFDLLFDRSDYQPDHLKIYPLALLREAPIYSLYESKKFLPYSADELTDLLVRIKCKIPAYCRIERVIRDIPADVIVEGGAKVSNLRQTVLQKMKESGLACQCIRCREIKNDFDPSKSYEVERIDYKASGGQEIFLSIVESGSKRLVSFLRLRIPSSSGKHPLYRSLQDAALIREMHTYGPQVAIGKNDRLMPQHQGYGKKLLSLAETIASDEFGLKKIAAIAGVGVRQYFRKNGYQLKQSYMIKELTN